MHWSLPHFDNIFKDDQWNLIGFYFLLCAYFNFVDCFTRFIASNNWKKYPLYFLSFKYWFVHVIVVVEVCLRIDTAVPSIRHNMFSYLSPWLLNIELVNPQIPTAGTFLPPTPKCVADTLSYNSGGAESSGADRRSRTGLQGYGWGSCQASEMVLNNMMYLTVRVGKCIHTL